MNAYLSELFSSIQGEGPYIGERHLFVRFCECHRGCVYCDTSTKRTKDVRIENIAGSRNMDLLPNPLSAVDLFKIIKKIDNKRNNSRISLTGGEPLLYANFLKEILPIIKDSGRSIYLETAGDLPDKLQLILKWVDIIAMDIKISSVTHEKNKFTAHWRFLELLRLHNSNFFLKVIVSEETDEQELLEVAEGIRDSGGNNTLLVLQPLTPTQKVNNIPSIEQIFKWSDSIRYILPKVRVIPQMHKTMNLL